MVCDRHVSPRPIQGRDRGSDRGSDRGKFQNSDPVEHAEFPSRVDIVGSVYEPIQGLPRSHKAHRQKALVPLGRFFQELRTGLFRLVVECPRQRYNRYGQLVVTERCEERTVFGGGAAGYGQVVRLRKIATDHHGCTVGRRIFLDSIQRVLPGVVVCP